MDGARDSTLYWVNKRLHIINFMHNTVFMRDLPRFYCNFLWTDFSLVGHVINTRLVQSEMQCGIQCSRHDSCQSYNYEHVGDNSGRLCELNGQTRESMTQDYLEKPGFTYYGQVEVRRTLSGLF